MAAHVQHDVNSHLFGNDDYHCLLRHVVPVCGSVFVRDDQ
jgi:hypothetical protein